MKGKKGIELALNFIVILIMSIIIFVGALYITVKFMNQANERKNQLDQETAQQIENLIADGSKVAIAFETKEIKRGHSDVFGLGIQNINRREYNFYVDISFNTSYGVNYSQLDSDYDYINTHWIFNDTRTFVIDPNDHLSIPLLVRAAPQMSPTKGTERGTYVFDVCVCAPSSGDYVLDCPHKCPPDYQNGERRDKLYDGYVHQIYVNVP